MNTTSQQNRRTKIILPFLIVLIAGTALGAEKQPNAPAAPIETQLKALEERVEAVRRDQLNYQIEKNLLKDAYASNLNTINTVITIVLGVFAVLGFLGVRSISGLRDQFKEELDKFRSQREDLERKLSEVEVKQKDVSIALTAVSETNELQDRRLKILEIQEKSSDHFKQKNYNIALDYIAVGLDLAPDNIILMRIKQHCYYKLGRLEDAVHVVEKMMIVDEESVPSLVLDLAELYLLLERFESHDELVAKYKREVESKHYLPWFFHATRCYLNNDAENLQQEILYLIDKLPEEQKPHMEWGLSEARWVFSKKPNSPEKQLFLKSLDVLEGKAEKEELANMLTEKVANNGLHPTAGQ